MPRDTCQITLTGSYGQSQQGLLATGRRATRVDPDQRRRIGCNGETSPPEHHFSQTPASAYNASCTAFFLLWRYV